MALLIASTVFVGAELDDLLRELRCSSRLSAIEIAVDRRLAGLHALVIAHRVRIGDEHVERDDRIIVQVVALCGDDAVRLHVFRDAGVVVILLDVRDERLARPVRRQRLGHGSLARPGCRRCRR